MSSLKKEKREQSRDLVSKILMNLFHMRLSVSLSNMPSSLKLSNFPSTVITEDAGHFIAGTSLSLMWSRWQHVRRLWWKCSHQGCNSNSFEITWISDKSFWTDLWANVTSSFIPPQPRSFAQISKPVATRASVSGYKCYWHSQLSVTLGMLAHCAVWLLLSSYQKLGSDDCLI